MAQGVEIIITASDKASEVFRDVAKEVRGLGGILGGALKAGTIAAGAGIVALGAGLAKSVSEAMESENALARLDAVLKSTGEAATKHAAEYAAAMGKTTTVIVESKEEQEKMRKEWEKAKEEFAQLPDKLARAQARLADMEAAWARQKTHTRSGALALQDAREEVAKLQAQLAKGEPQLKFTTKTIALTEALGLTAPVARITRGEILKHADALQKATRFSDETILSAQTVLLQFRSIGKDVFPKATEATLDLATALGTDAPNAARLLGKALETPGEGLLRLKAAGVAFTDAQEAQIKKMVEMGDVAGAQKLILDELEKSIGGAARAAGETFAGQLDILQNQISDILEEIGGAFLPILKDLTKTINDKVVPAVKEWVSRATPAIQEFAELFKTGDFAKIAERASEILGKLAGAATTELGRMAEAISKWLATNWDPKIKPELEKWAGKFWDWVGKAIESLAEAMGKLLGALGKWLQSADTQKALRNLGVSISNIIIGGIKAAFENSETRASLGKAIMSGLQEAVRGIGMGVFQLGWGIATGFADGTKKAFTGTGVRAETKSAMEKFGDWAISIIWNPDRWAEGLSICISAFLKFERTRAAIRRIGDLGGQAAIGMTNQMLSTLSQWSGQIEKEIIAPFQGAFQALRSIDWGGLAGGLASAIYNTLAGWQASLQEILTRPLQNARDAISDIDWGGLGYDIARAIWDQMNAWYDSLKGTLAGPLQSAYNTIRDTNWGGLAHDVAKSIYDTLTGWAEWIFGALYNPFSDAINAIRRLLGLAPPSRLMKEIGEQMRAGLELGFAQPQLAIAPAATGAARAAPAPIAAAAPAPIAPAPPSVTLNLYATVQDREDIELLAYRIADILSRRSR